MLTQRFAITLCTVGIIFQASADLITAETQLLCMELGMTPEAVCSAGLTQTQAAGSMGFLIENDSLVTTLRSAQSTLRAKREQLSNLKAQTRSAESPLDLLHLESEIEEARSEILSISTQVASIKTQIRAAFFGPTVSPSLVEQLCAPNAISASLPTPYRLADLDADEARELARVLQAISTGAMLRTESPLLLSVEAQTDVADALDLIEQNLDSVSTAMNWE